MAAPGTLYQATLAGRDEVYSAYIATGKGAPFLYPWDALPALYLILGILLRPRLNAQLRPISGYITFAAVVVHSLYVVVYRRSLGFASGYGIGLASVWGTIMTGVLLILHDPEKDYVRLEIREAAAATTYTQGPEGSSYSIDQNGHANEVKQRKNGDVTQTFVPGKSKQKKYGTPYRLVWQPFPTEYLHSIDWVLDLVTSFRGPNWNFRITTLPKVKTLPPPSQFKTTKVIETSILANEIHNPSDPGITAKDQKHITDTAKLYIFIDLVKAIMITDPYFLGLRPLSSPSPWPYLHDLPLLTRFIRVIISLTGVLTALSLIFSLSPLFFYTLLPRIIPQSTLIKYTRTPLYDPSMYVTLWTEPFNSIKRQGLGGFWGKSWHQMFRNGISEPSVPIVKALGLNSRSQLARAIQLLVAFCLSGMIHACASYTTFSIIRSKPWNPWFFFMLQAVGIIVQNAATDFLTKTMKLKFPVKVKQVTNVVYVVVWLWFTGPLLADDFARAGIWLFEPVPVSFIRGLTGQGWWHWWGFVTLQKGKGIFDTGIVVW